MPTKIFVKVDVWLSFALFAAGAWALLESRGFDEVSGDYPQALSLSIILLAIALFIEAVRNSVKDADSIKSLTRKMSGGMVILGLFILWTVLLSFGAGYLLSSLLVIAAVLWLSGLRNFAYVVLASSGIVGTVFILFYLLLNVPLPLHHVIQSLLG